MAIPYAQPVFFSGRGNRAGNTHALNPVDGYTASITVTLTSQRYLTKRVSGNNSLTWLAAGWATRLRFPAGVSTLTFAKATRPALGILSSGYWLFSRKGMKWPELIHQIRTLFFHNANFVERIGFWEINCRSESQNLLGILEKSKIFQLVCKIHHWALYWTNWPSHPVL